MGLSHDYYRNKYLLGEFTVRDLLEGFGIGGYFSVGVHWLPICRVLRSKSGRHIALCMDGRRTDPEVVLPMDSKVRLDGRVARVSGTHIRIELERPPFSKETLPIG